MAKTKTTKAEEPAVATASLLVITKPEEAVMLVSKWKETQKQIDDSIKLLNSFKEVTTDAQMKKLDDAISQAKKLSKEIGETGLEVRRPYNTIATTTKKFFDDKALPLDQTANQKLVILKAYQRTKEEKERAEAKALQDAENKRLKLIQEEKDTLIAWKEKVIQKIDESFTLPEMKEVFDTYMVPFSPDIFVNFKELATEYAKEIKALGALRVKGIKEDKIAPMDLKEVNNVEEKIESAPIVSQAPTFSVAPVIKLSNKTRKILSYRVDNEATVDVRFKSVDPEKVGAFMKEQSEMIKQEILNNVNHGGVEQFKLGGITYFYKESDYRS